MPKHLLVVDDEDAICWGLQKLGESMGLAVTTASSAEDGIQAAARSRPDVIVLDVRLPGMDGLAAIEHFQKTVGDVPIILITAYGDLKTAVEAIRGGAFEYIIKPFDLEHVQKVIQRSLQAAPPEPAREQPTETRGNLVGRTPAMQEVFKRIALAATSDACVLVTGESGTGKELVARAIHRYSRRSDGPFVAVNLASLSPSLAESELFGHVRGAFTGAEHSRPGLMMQANGGTLFLDEVADIPLPTQVKLLRAVETREVTPVGATEGVKTDFRVISATNRNLLEKVQDGSFREDFYFRLSAFLVDLPPLRQRRDDIVEIADHFLGLFARRDGVSTPRLGKEAMEELRLRPWYGNVRELRNAVEHAMIVARGGTILPEHLPAPTPVAAADERQGGEEERIASMVHAWAEMQLADPDKAEELYEKLLAIVEPPLLQAALARHRGQCATAARTLGMHRTTVRKKLDHYGIEGEE